MRKSTRWVFRAWVILTVIGSVVGQSSLPAGSRDAVSTPQATPPFKLADRLQVELAIEMAQKLFGARQGRIHGLIEASLGSGVSDEVIHYFQESYRAQLDELAPDFSLFDGRRSGHFLAQEKRTVRSAFRTDPALVVEVEPGRFVIFLGPVFFEIPKKRQAHVLLHELLHMLGQGFFDSTFAEFLASKGCYKRSSSASSNLQRFVEARCGTDPRPRY